jgi:hypothetical protein
MMKRLLYLSYYIKELDKEKFRKFVNHVAREHKIPKAKLYADIVMSSLKYNISINEYFLFRFYESSPEVRNTYAGTGFMYEYQLQMNPKKNRDVLEDKLQFLKAYKDFVLHDYASITDMQQDTKVAERLLGNKSGRIVLKGSNGQCGQGIEIRKTSELTPASLIQRLKELKNDYVEEFVEQHPDINALSPSGLNTVRVFTQLDANDNVIILGARLRITVNSAIDNMAAGNLAAPINAETGIVEGAGVYSDITKQEESIHPITGVPIKGFKVPYWQETMAMVKAAALLDKGNRSIGWDVAVTPQGPELIEGNHNWCKLLYQLPVKKGLKQVLTAYQK